MSACGLAPETSFEAWVPTAHYQMTMRAGGGLAHALACVLVLAGLVVGAGSSEMNHFTEE